MEKIKKIISVNELSIGNCDIDNDHRKLFDIYNDLVELIELEKSRKDFAKILSMMTDYSLIHFKREENYMKRLSYPKLSEHLNFHRDYIYKVATYNIDLLSINPPDPIDIVKFLEKWLLYHILNIDADYEIFKKENHLSINY